MVQTITAVYENGVLHPKVPLFLQEREEVQIQILVPDKQTTIEHSVDLAEPNDALDREMQAYIKMHPELKKQYLGKHVAVFQGNLIDHDGDYGTLVERVREKYPKEIIWVSTVREEAIPTIQMRSPRLIQE